MTGRCRRRGLLAAGLAAVMVASACSSTSEGDGTVAEPVEPVCGVIDPAEMQQTTGMDVSFVERGDPDPMERSWQCTVVFPEGGRAALENRTNTHAELIAMNNSLVSTGSGADGSVTRDWTSALGYTDQFERIDGYLRLPCTAGRPATDILVDLDIGYASAPEYRQPGYRQLAAVFVVTANALREHWDCEGEPLSLPEGLDDEVPEVVPVSSVEEACETFGRERLDAVLGELDESELPFLDAEPASWNVWQTPGDDVPATGCEIWRPPLSEDEVEGGHRYNFGPMLAFQRLAGHVGEQFDPEWFQTNHDDVTTWDVDLDAETALTGHRETDHYAADYFMVQRDCDGEQHTYTGIAYADTIPVEDYEPLLEEWIRGQAERDGCPIE